jgi:hypothetical protein
MGIPVRDVYTFYTTTARGLTKAEDLQRQSNISKTPGMHRYEGKG